MIEKRILNDAAQLILNSSRTTAFTGAGISVESGVPPFRGEGGLWDKYDPSVLDIEYFKINPEESWKVIKEIFYDFFVDVKPNRAHFVLAELEEMGLLHSVITQNIDNLHYDAGSKEVFEFHGNSRDLVCIGCGYKESSRNLDLEKLPPRCGKCNSVLKPDFVFFGEPIPVEENRKSWKEVKNADLFLIIGTSGEIMPASMIPYEAKKMGKKIVEVNISPSNYTNKITDIFLRGKASVVMDELLKEIKRIDKRDV